MSERKRSFQQLELAEKVRAILALHIRPLPRDVILTLAGISYEALSSSDQLRVDLAFADKHVEQAVWDGETVFALSEIGATDMMATIDTVSVNNWITQQALLR